MNIQTICDYLNKRLGINISKTYYDKIHLWEEWYKGYHRPFHHYLDYNGKETVELDRYSLKMAKKICEDWANLLLNEKTNIVSDNENANSFLKDVLSKNSFLSNANNLVEKTFALGTGAILVKIRGGEIRLDYITADCIIPISFDNRGINEVAFASAFNKKGREYTYLEIHLKDSKGNYIIKNECFDDCFNKVPLFEGVMDEVETNSPTPRFVILKPNVTNNIDLASPMGVSVYANSVDVLKGVDLAFDNLCTDFFLGGKMVMMNESMVAREQNGERRAPQFSKKRLFMSLGDSVIDGKMYEEYNPKLRVDENVKGVQNQLNYLSSKCGLGENFYNFEASPSRTATEVVYSNASLFRNVRKHENMLEEALRSLACAILETGGFKNTSVRVIFDDSVIEDKSREKEQDRADIAAGVMKKYEYRMKYYGESETEAKTKLKEEENE